MDQRGIQNVMRSIFSAAIAAFVVSFSPTAQSAEVLQKKQSSKIHIITIGVSKFSDSFWPELKWARNDANQFAQKIGTGTSLERVNVTLLDEKATLTEIRRKLSDVTTKAGRDDIVLLYISSHGTLRMGKSNSLEPVVVLYDSDKNNLSRSSLPHSELRRWVSELKSRRKAIILATCHSGVGKSKFTDEVQAFKRGEKGVALRPFESVSEGTLILAASSRNETALESDELKADVYSHYLLEGLETADRNGDGAVSLLEAHDYARVRTYAFTKGRQRPTVEAEMIGDADFPVKGRQRNSGLPILEGYSSKYEGYLVGVEKGEPVTLPSALPLSEGKNTIRVYEPFEEQPRQFIVKASTGERILVQDLMASPPFYFGLTAESIMPSDSKFQKITGLSNYFKYKIYAGYRWQFLDISAHYGLKKSFSKDVRYNLRSTLDLTGWGIQSGYVYSPLAGKLQLTIKPSFTLSRQSQTLRFRDNSAEDQQSNTSNTWAYGYLLESGLKLNRYPYALTLGAGQTFEKHSFEQFGSLNMNAIFYHLGLMWFLGAKAKEL